MICKFQSSPGSTSERIYLYFATVSDSKRLGNGSYGVGDEYIRVLELDVNELFEKLANWQIDDPKLAIAAYWLKDHMAAIEALQPETVEYEVVSRPDLILGYKTGDIGYVHGVDVWVNGENSDMMMDRFNGGSVSARIRALGANGDDNVVVDDTIQEELRKRRGRHAHLKIGDVLITGPGMLRMRNGVQRIFHVAVIKGSLGESKPNVRDLRLCVEAVLRALEQENKKIWRRFFQNNLSSVLFPMIGAGEGALPIQAVAEELIQAAINYFKSVPNPTIKKIYFLAFRLRERNACLEVLIGAPPLGDWVPTKQTMPSCGPIPSFGKAITLPTKRWSSMAGDESLQTPLTPFIGLLDLADPNFKSTILKLLDQTATAIHMALR